MDTHENFKQEEAYRQHGWHQVILDDYHAFQDFKHFYNAFIEQMTAKNINKRFLVDCFAGCIDQMILRCPERETALNNFKMSIKEYPHYDNVQEYLDDMEKYYHDEIDCEMQIINDQLEEYDND